MFTFHIWLECLDLITPLKWLEQVYVFVACCCDDYALLYQHRQFVIGTTNARCTN